MIYEVEFPDGQLKEYAANVIAENMLSTQMVHRLNRHEVFLSNIDICVEVLSHEFHVDCV